MARTNAEKNAECGDDFGVNFQSREVNRPLRKSEENNSEHEKLKEEDIPGAFLP